HLQYGDKEEEERFEGWLVVPSANSACTMFILIHCQVATRPLPPPPTPPIRLVSKARLLVREVSETCHACSLITQPYTDSPLPLLRSRSESCSTITSIAITTTPTTGLRAARDS
ncbi:MAG: hypothetical protein Q9194_007784, partial [Teloschistes cf. exilis]